MFGWLKRILSTGERTAPPSIAAQFTPSNTPISPAKLSLLSRFKSASTVDSISRPDDWAKALGAQPAKVIRQFLTNRLLQTADLATTVEATFNGVQLKALAKERGLPVSGAKKVLAQRLASADGDGMAKLVSSRQCYICTDAGLAAVEEFETLRLKAKQDAEAASMNALMLGQFRDACLIVGRHESQQVFSRGLGMDWKNYGRGSEVRALELIFSLCPERYRNLSSENLTTLRVAAGMLHLWGVSDASPWLNNVQLNDGIWTPEVATRMFLFLARHRERIEEFKAGGFRRVVVMTNESDTCPECQKHAGKVYQIGKVPNVPFERCTCPNGCLCMINADLNELR
jgi:hypothetical protein